MNDWVLLALSAAIAYLIGAVPFGFLVARWRGVDIFHEGSGNIGATNVGRVLGRKFGTLVFFLDFLKGALPSAAGTLVACDVEPDLPPNLLPVTAGVAAFLGHLFPLYLRFHGGKGVATASGALTVLLPLPTAIAVITWLVVVSSFGYVSLASLAAALALTLFRLAATPLPFARDNVVLTLFCVFATALVFVRHQANIRRLLAGRENRLKDSATMNALCKTLHVLAVGLWFGMAIFFSVVAVSLFGRFETAAETPPLGREKWFPVAPLFESEIDNDRFPKPLRKEQGTMAAGFAIEPLFRARFLIQCGCALVGLITAFAWRRVCGKVHKVRMAVLALAALTVLGGFWLDGLVSSYTHTRNEKTLTALNYVQSNSKEADEKVKEAAEERKTFAMWHGMSMGLNLLTMLLVTAAMGMAAFLPSQSEVCPDGRASGGEGRGEREP